MNKETDVHKLAFDLGALDPDADASISAIPTRRTWFAIVGEHGWATTPSSITDDVTLAHARARVATADFPASGPFHVVTLTERVRA